jgi:hypothetical protein
MREFSFVRDLVARECHMLTATMSRVRTNLESAEISASVFAKVAAVPVSSLTAALRDGSHYFGGQEEARLLTLSVRLSEMVESLRPLQVGKGDAESLKVLLESEKSPQEVRAHVAVLFE